MFVTAWDSQEEMTTAFASEAHKKVGGKFKPFLVAPSSVKVYQVHEVSGS
jgi:heme-degrading monooxygenase HmoA